MMEKIVGKDRSKKDMSAAKFWKRDDVMVVAGGSLPCIRVLYVLAKEIGKLHQFRYIKLTLDDYTSGAAEGKITNQIREAAKIPGVNVIVFYLSCLDILGRMNFPEIEKSLSKETGKYVCCFFHGPLSKGHPEAEELMKHWPKEEGHISKKDFPIVPLASDISGIFDWARQKGNADILTGPMGCRMAMCDLDMTEEDINGYYPKLTGSDLMAGMESKIEAQTEEMIQQKPVKSLSLIGTSVADFMGVRSSDMVKRLSEKGIETYFFNADGMHDAPYGIARAEWMRAQKAAGRLPLEKGQIVQVMGYSPLLCGEKNQYQPCLDFLKEKGIQVIFDGEEELPALPALNWVVSASGVPAGEWMQETRGIPLLISAPAGDHALSSWKKMVTELMEAGEGRKELCIHNMNLPEKRKEKVLFIGDPVLTMSAAHVLWHEGFKHIVLASYAWTKETEDLYRKAPGGDKIQFIHSEEDLHQLVSEADIVIADEWLAPEGTKKTWIDWPQGVVSGRRAWKKSGVMEPEFIHALQHIGEK